MGWALRPCRGCTARGWETKLPETEDPICHGCLGQPSFPHPGTGGDGSPAGAASECWVPVPHSGRTLSRERDSSWVTASLSSQPEPRLLPHPHTGSFPSWVSWVTVGHSTVTGADAVHTGERFYSGVLVGGPELLIPALLHNTPTHYPQVEFGAAGWALGKRKPAFCVWGVSDFRWLV